MKHLINVPALLAAALTCGLVAMAAPGGGEGPGNRQNDTKHLEVPGVGRLPKNVELPDALKKALDEFNALRLKQHELQKELAAKLGTATAEEKQKIKDQLRASRDQFAEDTKQLRADIREQIKALREKLKDTLPVDGGDRGGKGRGRKGG